MECSMSPLLRHPLGATAPPPRESAAAGAGAERLLRHAEESPPQGDRLPWPGAALAVGGASLLLWAALIHLGLRLIG